MFYEETRQKIQPGQKKSISDDLINEKEKLRLISDMPDSHAKKWLQWYGIRLKNRRNKFFIKKNAPEFLHKKLIEWTKQGHRPLEEKLLNALLSNPDLCRENKLYIKDIVLPVPVNGGETICFHSSIRDSLFPYLLEDYEQGETIVNRLTYEGPYEFGNVHIEKGDVVIDAGAAIGEFSALASVRAGDTGNVYAFEPVPEVIETYLSKTVQYNKNIQICEYALSDFIGSLSIDYYGFEMASFVDGAIAKTPRYTLSINATTLDDFTNTNNISRINFIKADIEGAERQMLKGAKYVLKDFAPKIAICTYHLPDDPMVLRELIMEANPNYKIEEKWMKMFAYVPKVMS